eukprot:TRINITY_DN4829_c0_g1_i4.p1 TRINITY_DN4829_c0_g1~~TRINITY_DN4829_c0_g1_i4.p1  ORF type:complete len:199 (+),score=77.82 TRINITY_DN4829_c0_g1_i4:147-743(+)
MKHKRDESDSDEEEHEEKKIKAKGQKDVSKSKRPAATKKTSPIHLNIDESPKKETKKKEVKKKETPKKEEKKKESKSKLTKVWSVDAIWNGGRRMETLDVFLSMDDANELAKAYFFAIPDRDTDYIEEIKDTPGEPFEAFTTIGIGQASIMVSVSDGVAPRTLKVPTLKRLLEELNADTKGKKDELVQRLSSLIAPPS